MKRILLFLFVVVLLFQSGCANSPSIEEQALQQRKEDQTVEKSDAFARGLQQ
jgi:hypothetical protein